MQLSPKAQEIVNFWKNNRDIPFKGELIHRNDDGTCSMCAQGQVLYKNGISEEELFKLTIREADKRTAEILGISVAHSVFLRHINDNEEGSPQEVLTNPGKYLGPNWEAIINFWIYLDTLTKKQLKVVENRYNDLSFDKSVNALVNVRKISNETTKYAYDAASAALCSDFYAKAAARYATRELIANVDNPVFVPMFYNFMKIIDFKEIYKIALNIFGFNKKKDNIYKNPDYENFLPDEMQSLKKENDKLKKENSLIREQLSGKIYDV